MRRAGFIVATAAALALIAASVASGASPCVARPGQVPPGPFVLPPPIPDPPLRVQYARGPLAGLVVYLSPGHGKHLTRSRVRAGHPPIDFGWQRTASNGVREDVFTWEVARRLAARLEAAGAVVIGLRELDPHPEEAVADDGSDAVTIDGQVDFDRDEAEGEQGTVAAAGSTATFHLVAPTTGELRLTARWIAGSDRDPEASFVVHPPGRRAYRVVVDQREHGGAWWPLGTLSVTAGDPVVVELVGSGGGALSVDRVRLGGGTRQRENPWDASRPFRYPRWEGSAYEYLVPDQTPAAFRGVPWTETLVTDARIRGVWTTLAHPPEEEAIYLSIHTNAWGYQRGTSTFWGVETDPPTPAWPESRRLAELVQRHTVEVGRAYSPRWRDLGAHGGDYSEISPRWNSVRAAALVEVGYHTNAHDAAILRRPEFQDDLADALLAAIEEYRGP